MKAADPYSIDQAATSTKVRVVTASVPGDLPVLTLRATRGPERVVFLHGMCSEPESYLRSFRFAAARFGRTIALQGDLTCPGRPGRRTWSRDVGALDRRVAAAWRAIGDDRPLRDLVVIGYSLGAVRAEALAHHDPERYTRLVLIGGPKEPAARDLRTLDAAVLVAGDRDRQAPMKAGQRAFEKLGVPATFLALPKAAHGEMGPDAEHVMRRAFDFLQSTTTSELNAGG